ncbi:uncharacterized protein [Petaurus breviceps papuanus]|uniref:uncharacterized protein n=1 Tax=Petaurus breviceps papuanus TaxID=3040969 RepID=UPI0036DCC6AF
MGQKKLADVSLALTPYTICLLKDQFISVFDLIELLQRCPASKANSSARPLSAPLSVLPSARPPSVLPSAPLNAHPSALPRLPALLQSLPAVALALEDAAALGGAVGPALGDAAALAPGMAAASFPITEDPTDAGTRGLTAVTVAVGAASSLEAVVRAQGAAVGALGAAADHLALSAPRTSNVEPKANNDLLLSADSPSSPYSTLCHPCSPQTLLTLCLESAYP